MSGGLNVAAQSTSDGPSVGVSDSTRSDLPVCLSLEELVGSGRIRIGPPLLPGRQQEVRQKSGNFTECQGRIRLTRLYFRLYSPLT